jgi:hypothetical protein
VLQLGWPCTAIERPCKQDRCSLVGSAQPLRAAHEIRDPRPLQFGRLCTAIVEMKAKTECRALISVVAVRLALHSR